MALVLKYFDIVGPCNFKKQNKGEEKMNENLY